MSTTSSRVPLFSVEKLRGDFFPWVLAVVTGLDYFDNSIFSFFTSYIAGGINASPDELVWSSSAYAIAAVSTNLRSRLKIRISGQKALQLDFNDSLCPERPAPTLLIRPCG